MYAKIDVAWHSCKLQYDISIVTSHFNDPYKMRFFDGHCNRINNCTTNISWPAVRYSRVKPRNLRHVWQTKVTATGSLQTQYILNSCHFKRKPQQLYRLPTGQYPLSQPSSILLFEKDIMEADVRLPSKSYPHTSFFSQKHLPNPHRPPFSVQTTVNNV
jgi:hypothetical protein